jgi:DNA end-binding protein Ku
MYTATQDNDIHFNQLCKEDGSRVRYKKVCAGCGKEVGNEDIIKGFEYEKDKFAVITDDELEKAKTDKDRAIQILQFTDIDSIPPVYYDKTYNIVPENGGEKAFELLRRAMKDENKVAIAKTVMGTKEKLLALIPADKGISAETLFYSDEIKDAPKESAAPETSGEELQMAKTLINAMVKSFEPEKYRDGYREKLWELINRKIQGQEITVPQPEMQVSVINIMDALKESLARVGAGK